MPTAPVRPPPSKTEFIRSPPHTPEIKSRSRDVPSSVSSLVSAPSKESRMKATPSLLATSVSSRTLKNFLKKIFSFFKISCSQSKLSQRSNVAPLQETRSPQSPSKPPNSDPPASGSNRSPSSIASYAAPSSARLSTAIHAVRLCSIVPPEEVPAIVEGCASIYISGVSQRAARGVRDRIKHAVLLTGGSVFASMPGDLLEMVVLSTEYESVVAQVEQEGFKVVMSFDAMDDARRRSRGGDQAALWRLFKVREAGMKECKDVKLRDWLRVQKMELAVALSGSMAGCPESRTGM